VSDRVGLDSRRIVGEARLTRYQSPEVLQSKSNEILTAVVQGARKEETNEAVQIAAIHALYNSLEFIRDNFEREVSDHPSCAGHFESLGLSLTTHRASAITSCKWSARRRRTTRSPSRSARLNVSSRS
jgi:hypothetical protein